jgi:hypothetical protein
MQIRITQYVIDPGTGNLKQLPSVHTFDQAEINDIYSISIGPFTSETERDEFASKFPKSYKVCRPREHAHLPNGDINFDVTLYSVYFSFQTFWSNKVTGDKNEAAIKRRLNVIKKIKALMK